MNMRRRSEAKPVAMGSVQATDIRQQVIPLATSEMAQVALESVGDFFKATKSEVPPDPTGPNVFPTQDQGEAIEVTWGEVLIPVAPYTNFRHGPFQGTTTVRAGESRADAYRRLSKDLEGAAEESFGRKLAQVLAQVALATGVGR